MSAKVTVESDALSVFQESLTIAEQLFDPIVVHALASAETQREWIGGQLLEAANVLEEAAEALFSAQSSYEAAKNSLDAANASLGDATSALADAESKLS